MNLAAECIARKRKSSLNSVPTFSCTKKRIETHILIYLLHFVTLLLPFSIPAIPAFFHFFQHIILVFASGPWHMFIPSEMLIFCFVSVCLLHIFSSIGPQIKCCLLSEVFLIIQYKPAPPFLLAHIILWDCICWLHFQSPHPAPTPWTWRSVNIAALWACSPLYFPCLIRAWAIVVPHNF